MTVSLDCNVDLRFATWFRDTSISFQTTHVLVLPESSSETLKHDVPGTLARLMNHFVRSLSIEFHRAVAQSDWLLF